MQLCATLFCGIISVFQFKMLKMKKIFLFFVGMVCTLNMFGQAENWFFSLSMGTSLPMGSFKEIKTLDEKAGFAEKGFSLVLDASYPLGDNWSLKGAAMLYSNPINRSGMGTMLEQRMNARNIIVTGDDRDYLTLQLNSWLSNNIVFGPVYTINLNKFYWDFQVLAGMNVTQLPKQKLAYENPELNWIYLQRNTSSTSLSVGYGAGTVLRFAIASNVNFKLGIDYFRSQATQKYEELKITKNGTSSTTEKLSTGEVKTPIESLSATVGLVYYL